MRDQTDATQTINVIKLNDPKNDYRILFNKESESPFVHSVILYRQYGVYSTKVNMRDGTRNGKSKVALKVAIKSVRYWMALGLNT